MKIREIEVYQVDLPYAGGTYRLSGGRTYTSFDATLVCIRTDTGLEGWGESTPFGPNYIASHARLRSSVPIIFDELATDEVSILQLIGKDAAEGIDLKISKNGGLTKANARLPHGLAFNEPPKRIGFHSNPFRTFQLPG